jgi:hypothetical protein
MNENNKEVRKIESWRLRLVEPFKILVNPIPNFENKKNKSFLESIFFMLFFGLITSVSSAYLAIYLNIDYANPSNCGGSAQIFADWVVFKYIKISNSNLAIIVFIIANELGYLILGILSVIIITLLVKIPKKNNFKNLIEPSMAGICYGMTPGLLLGWIPNPFFLIGIMAAIYQSLAIWKILDLSKKAAILIILGWILITGVLHDIIELLLKFFIS